MAILSVGLTTGVVCSKPPAGILVKVKQITLLYLRGSGLMMAKWLGCWTQDSRSHGFDPHTEHGLLLKFRQFHLPQ